MDWKYGQQRDEVEMNKRILVTGGAGYIGSVFVPQLLEKGYLVTVMDNFIYHQNSLLDVCYHPNLKIIVGDVRDEKLLKTEVQKHDIIIPLAAIVGAPACDKDKTLTKDINQVQIENIARVKITVSLDNKNTNASVTLKLIRKNRWKIYDLEYQSISIVDIEKIGYDSKIKRQGINKLVQKLLNKS